VRPVRPLHADNFARHERAPFGGGVNHHGNDERHAGDHVVGAPDSELPFAPAMAFAARFGARADFAADFSSHASLLRSSPWSDHTSTPKPRRASAMRRATSVSSGAQLRKTAPAADDVG
jgi:hypothetical protein